MTYPGSGGPGWPGDPSGQSPAQPGGGQPGQPGGGQPGQPGGGQPGYGQPGYGQPGYGQQPPFQPPQPTTQLPAVPPSYGSPPPYGQQPGGYGQQPPVPPGYGTPYGPQPQRSGGSKTPLIAGLIVVLLMAGGVLAYFLTKDDKKTPVGQKSTGVSTGAPSTGGFPSTTAGASSGAASSAGPSGGSSGASPGDISESNARAVVAQYLQDVNDQDRTDAATLICPELVDTWRSSIDKASGDFTVTVTKSTFQGSTPVSRGLDLKYSLDVKSVKTSQTGVSPVTFTIVDRSGDLLICGERVA